MCLVKRSVILAFHGLQSYSSSWTRLRRQKRLWRSDMLYSADDASFRIDVCTAPPLGLLCRQGGISGGFDVAYIAKTPRFIQSNLDIASKNPCIKQVVYR